ncbi:MAG: hypothetical protein JNK04_07530 [Myxococcales bacterium]|nr:hypothetical protein [Myxococcales bacterium]
MKLAPWGAHLWSKRFGSTTLDDRGLAVTSDAAGNVFLGARGGTGLDLGGGVLPGSSGATIGMFDASGNHVWSKRYGDSGDDVVTVTTDGAGDLLFTGSFNGSLSFGGSSLTSLGSFDVYAVKLGP